MPLTYRLTRHDFSAPFRPANLKAVTDQSSTIKAQASDVRLLRGIFGLPTTSLLTMAALENHGAEQDLTLPGSTIASTEDLTPTARPKAIGPLPEGGMIVLRWFQIDDTSFDEFVALSDEAWISLEASFDCQIIGLFRAANAPEGKIRMLLYTWYASHGEWERSRDARPEAGASKAWENFTRRHLLTDFTEASVVAEIPLD